MRVLARRWLFLHHGRMARPVNADADATKARILRRSCALISANGIAGTSVRDIAAAAEVSLATVLHYFGSKDGLYQACISAMREELSALRVALLAAVRPDLPHDALITGMVEAAWSFCLQHRPAHLLLLRAALDQGIGKSDIDMWLKPAIADAETVLAPVFGMSAEEAGLAFQSVVHLLVRYALHTPEELMLISKRNHMTEAEQVMGAHIAHVARCLFVPTSK
jgi:AcrR family transcriptional regulator